MKVKEVELYEYQDLIKPENCKILETVINNWNEDYSYIYDEAKSTINAFIDMVPFLKTYNSYFEPNFNSVDSNILELPYLRLRTWLVNNLELHKRKYLKCFHSHKKHRMIVNKKGYQGKPYCFAYSNIQKTTDCVLTGMCYDHSILEPIYKFIVKPYNTDFETLIKECFSNLEVTIENEIEYRNSKEAILESIEANNYTFNSSGEIEY